MIRKRLIETDNEYLVDIIFNIGLQCKFKKSIAIISSCKSLWNLRTEFFKRKHLLCYDKPMLNFWTPEMHFYASGCQFTLLVNVNGIEDIISFADLYQHNNTIENMKYDYDYFPTFTIEGQWLVIWNIYSVKNDSGPVDNLLSNAWSFTFHNTRKEVDDKILSVAESDDTNAFEYAVIDLQITIPCWTLFRVTAKLDYEYKWVDPCKTSLSNNIY